MNPLQEMLQEQSRSVDPIDHADRVQQVRRRVTVVRRRRAVGALTAAVLALGGVTGIVQLNDKTIAPPTSHVSAPATLVGRTVPVTLELGGATYRYSQGVSDPKGVAHLRVPARSEGVYVRVATSAEHGQVTTRIGGADSTPVVLESGDFGYAQFIGAGDPVDFSATAQSGAVGVALYTLATPPSGVTVDGYTYPDLVGGDRLLAASIGKPGVKSLGFDASTASRQLDLAPLCVGAPQGYGVRVGLGAGQGYLMLGGCDTTRDWNAFSSPARVHASAVNGKAHFTVTFVDKNDEPVALPAGARIGLGVYAPPAVQQSFDTLIDFDGHTWKLARTQVVPGNNSGTLVDGRAPIAVAFGSLNLAEGTKVLMVNGREAARQRRGGRSTLLVATGERVTDLRLMSDAKHAPSVPFGIYELVE